MKTTQPDDELIAYYAAGQAVAMWALGLGIHAVSIEPKRGFCAYAQPARQYELTPETDIHTRQFIIEQYGLYLHAGDAAQQLLWPGIGADTAGMDHRRVHDRMSQAEVNGSIQITWCNHLWQRAYHLLECPGQWYLVAGLAHQLLEYRTLLEAEAERYLSVADERLQYEPWMPSVVLVGQVTHVCSPWHREWHATSIAAVQNPKSANLPATIADLSARVDSRPIESVLTPLSARARGLLARLGIRTVVDLEDWNEWSLGGFPGGGEKTVKEIIDAAARTGTRMAAPGPGYPWQLNPARWRHLPQN